jgi:4-hydroxy-tetrahydrodipicolinate reductase
VGETFLVKVEVDIMREPFRVFQIGFGTIGRTIAQAIIERKNLELVGLVDVDPNLQGQYVEEILGLDSRTHTMIQGSLEESIAASSGPSIDVAVVATVSDLERVMPTVSACLRAGMDVVSICEQLSYPFNRHPKLAGELDELARELGKTVVGTGINPGYLMDLLPIMLSAPLQSVDSIEVTRVINSSHRRASFQRKIGTGLSKDEFRKSIDKGVITGHVGLDESIRMVGNALNLGLDRVEELPVTPVVAEKETTTPFTTVQKGDVLGLKSRGVGNKEGKTLVTLDFFAYAEASPEYDEIRINGHPNLVQRVEGGVHGDLGTVAMVVNMIPLVAQSEPGLKTMKDLPAPRNTERIWK